MSLLLFFQAGEGGPTEPTESTTGFSGNVAVFLAFWA